MTADWVLYLHDLLSRVEKNPVRKEKASMRWNGTALILSI